MKKKFSKQFIDKLLWVKKQYSKANWFVINLAGHGEVYEERPHCGSNMWLPNIPTKFELVKKETYTWGGLLEDFSEFLKSEFKGKWKKSLVNLNEIKVDEVERNFNKKLVKICKKHPWALWVCSNKDGTVVLHEKQPKRFNKAFSNGGRYLVIGHWGKERWADWKKSLTYLGLLQWQLRGGKDMSKKIKGFNVETLRAVKRKYPWANWLAMERSKEIWVFIFKPFIFQDTWVGDVGSESWGGSSLMESPKRIDKDHYFPTHKIDWKDSLVDLNNLEDEKMDKEKYYVIFVPTPEISNAVQHRLFKKGYRTNTGGALAVHTDYPVIFVYSSKGVLAYERRVEEGQYALMNLEDHVELSIPDLFWNFPNYQKKEEEKKERTLNVRGREFSETTVWNALHYYLQSHKEDC